MQKVSKMNPKSADPCGLRVRASKLTGGGLPPPHPPPPGPPRRNRWAQFVYSHSLRKLGPNFGSNPKILPRPASNTFSSTFCNFTRRGSIFDLYSYIGAMVPLPINVPRALCMGWPLPINVQRALCTVKAISQTYRHPSARLRFVRASISIHILGPWSADVPNGKFW